MFHQNIYYLWLECICLCSNELILINKINQIHRDLSTLINFFKFINYRIIIYGDFNARIGNEISDILQNGKFACNINGYEKIIPFYKWSWSKN